VSCPIDQLDELLVFETLDNTEKHITRASCPVISNDRCRLNALRTDAFPNAILWPLFPAATKLTDYGFVYGYLGLIIGFGVTALSLILYTRGRLGYQHYRPENASSLFTVDPLCANRRQRIASPVSVAGQRHHHRR
jgi:hypothetical protein